MLASASTREGDCGDAVRDRAADVANHHLAADLDTPVLLVGLRADGREFLLFLDHCFPGDLLRRRRFIAFILGREDVIAYAYASRYADLVGDASDRLHIVAWSRQRVTLTYYELRRSASGALTWTPTEAHEFAGIGAVHATDVALPDADEMDDAAQFAEYEAAWRSLHDDGTRCFWRWNVGRQQPGFPFPTAFAGRSIVGFAARETRRTGRGFQASYAVVDSEVLDLYAYASPAADAPRAAPDDEALLGTALERACDAIRLVNSRTWRRRAQLMHTGTMTVASPCGRPFRFGRFRLESADLASVSYVVLARYRGTYVEMRLTVPEESDADRRADRAAAWLASYLGGLEPASRVPSQEHPAEQHAA